MYSSLRYVNMLTQLLLAHGIRHAVVCPGSRNSPLVHNLNEAPGMECYPVTDERSAGFFALGISLITREPVVVCVTSGTALLNLYPSVAEAFYQHVPLIVVSADRPAAWIGQQDGQSLPQPDALGRFVGKAVSLPDGESDEEVWYANRMINEALLACRQGGGAPVHINVPLHEPLYVYNNVSLPNERIIRQLLPRLNADAASMHALMACKARRRMVVIGQMPPAMLDAKDLERISQHAVIVGEALSQYIPGQADPEEMIQLIGGDAEKYRPEVVVSVGGCVVSKRLKAFLRHCDARVIEVSESGEVNDTFCHLSEVITGSPRQFIHVLAGVMDVSPARADEAFVDAWRKVADEANRRLNEQEIEFSADGAVRLLAEMADDSCVLNFGNSTAVRLANRYVRSHVFCNRGVNGIEGTLSTGAGIAAVTDKKVVSVVGDLSFFYDQNALWNQNLSGNMRILLLNNHGGGIFSRFDGLRESPARERLVMAEHPATAEGICIENNCHYIKATTVGQMRRAIHELIYADSRRPIVLELNFNTI